MQNEDIILIPPTHEQSTPAFHVEGSLAAPFLEFLKENGVDPWQPPEVLEKDGADDKKLVEITVEAGTPLDFLEDILGEFLEMEPSEESEP